MSLYSRLDRIAADVEKLNRQVTAVANSPQSQRTSVEGGSIDFNDADGNLKAIVGEQDDGGTTVNVIAGPTPPTPANFTVTVDHGSLTVHWDGDFEGGVVAPSDWARWTAYAQEGQFVVPDRTTSIGGTDSASGGEVTAGVLKGEWTVTLLAWSQAGKPSAMATPVTVVVPGYGDIVLEEIDAAETVIRNAGEVLVTEQDTLNDKLTDAFGQIDDAVASANGKNVVHYEDRAPTVDDAGTEGDTWFVGQVGRPNDVIGATNLAANPSFQSLALSFGSGNIFTRAGAVAALSDDWSSSGVASLKISGGTSWYTSAYVAVAEGDFLAQSKGKTFTASIDFHLEAAHDDTIRAASRRLTVNVQRGGSMQYEYAVSDKAGAAAGTTERLSVTFTVPSDAEAWNVTAFNGSQTSTSYWDSFDFAEVSTARPYFDGDTTDGATEDDPHYRWTGTPHASTSEKYLPATEGLSSNWNVTEQYRFINGVWESVELSHTVLSSLDLGKLVAGSAAIKEAVVQKLWAEVVVTKMAVAEQFIGENAILTGAVTAPKITASEELWAKIAQFVKIRAEHIEADALDSMVITGPTIQSGRSGRRWVGDPNGIRIINEDNDVRTHLSPDGSTFKGEVEAETLVVNEGAEFKGNNTLAQGAKLMLAAGVTDPTAPPTVQPFWDGLEFTQPNKSEGTLTGLAFDGTSYWSAINRGFFLTAPYGPILRVNATTGAVSTFAYPAQEFDETFGVTCIGSELFWLYRSGYEGRILVTDLDCVKKREMPWSLGYSKTNPLTYRPGIGNDGTNIVIAHCTDSGRLDIHTCNKTTGAIISTVNDSTDLTRSDITGVYVGNADWGRKLVTVAKKSTGKLPSFNATTGVYDGSTTQFDAASPESTGVVYVDGKFRTLDPSGVIHEYADSNTGDGSGDWWATYRWTADTTPEDQYITNWSRISPPTRFVWPRRASLRVIGQPLPSGVQSIGPSLAKKTSRPNRTDFHSPAWSPREGTSVASWYSLPANWEAAAVPQDANNFPEAESSVLESASGTFQVKGDGSGHWGPLTMGRNGIMSGLIITGFGLFSVDEGNVSKKYTIALPAGRFTKPPVVWAQISSTVPHLADAGIPGDGITTTTFDLWFNRINTTSTGVTWFAMDRP